MAEIFVLYFLAEPALIVMEFARLGNLVDFLRENRRSSDVTGTRNPYDRKRSRPLTVRDLTSFALHVSQGMHFISSKRVS